MPRQIKRYGWIPDLPDQRDHLYAAPIQALEAMPTSVDLRSGCPDVYDQGQLGSCTANAIAGAIEFDQIKQKIASFIPSRLFIYYNERVIEGTTDSDSGAMIRDGIKSVGSQGVCSESEWPYNITQFQQKPSDQCYQDALLTKAILYQSVLRNLDQMKGCLASGYPFVFGFTVHESFESAEVASTGVVPMPTRSESVLGGHACLCCGYDDSQQRFIFRNSWSDSWADKGYGYMPFAYLTNRHLATDFWTIRVVGQ